jgi:hypothetical protein
MLLLLYWLELQQGQGSIAGISKVAGILQANPWLALPLQQHAMLEVRVDMVTRLHFAKYYALCQ